MIKNTKGLSGEEIIGHIVVMWTSTEIMPLKYLHKNNEELQQCLGTYGLEDQNTQQDFLAVDLSLSVIYFHI